MNKAVWTSIGSLVFRSGASTLRCAAILFSAALKVLATAAGALAVGLVLTAALGGCARVTLPDRDLAAQLQYNQAVKERYQIDPRWWKSYGDAGLDALVELALTNNHDLAASALNLKRALIQAGLTELDLYPKLSGSGSTSTRRDLKGENPATRSFGVNFGLSYEIDLWRRVALAATASQWEYMATAEDLEATRQTLINKVVDAYYNLAYLNDALAQNERNLRNLLAVEKTVLVKHENGQATAVEPIQAAQSVLSARDAILNARQQLVTASQTMRNLLNLGPADDLGLEALTLKGVKPPGVDLSVPLSVLANRPDLKAAEFRLYKAFSNTKIAERAWLPTISLSSAISSSSGTLDRLWANPSASLGLSLSLPFLDWPRLEKNVRLSELEYETVRLSFESALKVALNEIDVFYQNYQTITRLLEHSRRRHSYNLRISEYYRDRYQAGAAELSDWLSAVNSANSSGLSALNTLYQSIAAQNQIFEAMAGRYVDSGAALGPDNAQSDGQP
ncbi:MAG: TolC family protein [Deltaproteobacteria bacterium]|jgi:outer membrane protein TolC|nr:TolC family protein [Deltaproteobacteria bacterium]